jgi:uncharacterized membrane protein HdeD (DUF308 family)
MVTNEKERKKMTLKEKAQLAVGIAEKIQRLPDRHEWFSVLSMVLTLLAGSTYLLVYRNEIFDQKL